jgi:preprotein translocase subunit SecD
MRRIVGLIAILALLGCAKQTDRATIEFRLVETAPAEGLTEMVCAASGELFYLHDEVLISNADIDTAFISKWNNRPVVELLFTEDGREQFAQLTEENIHRRVGMLVDGQLVSAPIINAPIPQGRAIIDGNFSEQEVRRVAEGIIASKGQ